MTLFFKTKMAAFVVLSFIVLIKPLDYGLILQYLRSIS